MQGSTDALVTDPLPDAGQAWVQQFIPNLEKVMATTPDYSTESTCKQLPSLCWL